MGGEGTCAFANLNLLSKRIPKQKVVPPVFGGNESGQSIIGWILIGRLRWSVGGPLYVLWYAVDATLSLALGAIGNIHVSHIFVTQKFRSNGFHSRELFIT